MAENRVSIHAVFKDDASKGMKGLQSLVTGVGMGVGMRLFDVGTDLLMSFGQGLIETGPKLEAMDAKAKTVFGDQLPMIQKWAKGAAGAMGLTDSQLIAMSSNLQDLLVPMGFVRADAAGMTSQVMNLAGALSEWSGGTRSAEEVGKILTKGMLGERDALKELGISITEAEVSGRLLQKGQNKLTGQALAQAKAEATLEMYLEKTTDAQKAYTDGTAKGIRAQNQMNAAVNQLQEDISRELYPIIQTITVWLSENLPGAIATAKAFFGQLGDAVKDFVDLAQQYMSYIQPVVDHFVVAIQSAFAVVQGLVEMVGALLRGDWQGVWDGAGRVVGAFANVFSSAIGNLWRLIGQFVRDLGGSIGDGIRGMVANVQSVLGGMVGFIAGMPGKITTAAKGMWDGIWQAFRGALNTIVRAWNSLQFTIPGFSGPWGIGWGGVTIGTPDLPTFHQGGIVPGGGDTLAMLRGGEGVFTPQQMAAMGGAREVHIHIDRGAYIDAPSLDWLTRTITARMRTSGVT